MTGGTGAGGNASLPAALAGGKALAFVSDRSGSPQVWVMDAAGANQIQVTSAGSNTSPSWSYDNRFLYYVGERDGQTSVYRLDITTGNEEALVSDPSIVSARPLPNGRLALLRTENGSYSLFVGDRRLFQLDRAFQFQFSPDGSRVVIDPNAPPRVISVVDVATTRAAGGGRRERPGMRAGARATASPTSPTAPASPPSTWPGRTAKSPARSRPPTSGARPRPSPPTAARSRSSAATARRGTSTWSRRTGGAERARVGGPANPGKSPVWQPAGRLIAYESNRAGNWDIYVTDPDGNERALTERTRATTSIPPGPGNTPGPVSSASPEPAPFAPDRRPPPAARQSESNIGAFGRTTVQ